jgi:hypothetical protein
MGQTFKLAWRNMWRNWRRTIIAVVAIVLGLILLLLFDGIINDRFHVLPHPIDQRFQQIALGIEVVIERSFGDLQFIQNVLNRHLIVALGVNQPLGYVDDFFALDRVIFFLYGTRHTAPLIINRPSV